MNHPIRPFQHIRLKPKGMCFVHQLIEPQEIAYRMACRQLRERRLLVPGKVVSRLKHERMVFTFRIKRGMNPMAKSCIPMFKKNFGGLGMQWSTEDPKVWCGEWSYTSAN